MKILNQIINRAKKINCTLIMPEAGVDERVYNACLKLLKDKTTKLIVFNGNIVFSKAFLTNPRVQVIDIEHSDKLKQFASQLYQLRKHKGMTPQQAKKLVSNPEYFACMMLYNGLADGMLAGASWTTTKVLRPALQIIKTKPNHNLAVGSILMLSNKRDPLLLADVSLNEAPTSQDLSQIAISSAKFMESILGVKPCVAMLSYSTMDSAQSDMVNKVKQAVKLTNGSGYMIDGEMQADTALEQLTATKKMPNSVVAGNANVLIFPDLNSGNIGYKLIAHFSDYTAIGPIILNLNKPVNDLSRGSTEQEIITTAYITKLMINIP